MRQGYLLFRAFGAPVTGKNFGSSFGRVRGATTALK
jgi:hypothetical protein